MRISKSSLPAAFARISAGRVYRFRGTLPQRISASCSRLEVASQGGFSSSSLT